MKFYQSWRWYRITRLPDAKIQSMRNLLQAKIKLFIRFWSIKFNLLFAKDNIWKSLLLSEIPSIKRIGIILKIILLALKSISPRAIFSLEILIKIHLIPLRPTRKWQIYFRPVECKMSMKYSSKIEFLIKRFMVLSLIKNESVISLEHK